MPSPNVSCAAAEPLDLGLPDGRGSVPAMSTNPDAIAYWAEAVESADAEDWAFDARKADDLALAAREAIFDSFASYPIAPPRIRGR